MTYERAIEILNPEHREHYESLDPVNEACRMGMEALKFQQSVTCCAECDKCFSLADTDPMTPYTDEDKWYCQSLDKEFSAFDKDPVRFFCRDGKPRKEVME